MKLVIVGGVAGGASAAARARRLSEEAEIVVFERGPDVSFANCGLPYHIGEKIVERDKLLVVTPERLRERFRLDVRTRTNVESIDRSNKTVTVRNLDTGAVSTESYDKLILAPGAAPIRPPIPGADLPGVLTLRTLQDMDAIKRVIDRGSRDVLVVGAGFIGLEVVENLIRRGVRTTLVQLQGQILSQFDAEMTTPLLAHLRAKGVDVILGQTAKQIEVDGEHLRVTLTSGQTLSVGMVLMGIGVGVENRLAKDAGLETGSRGGIRVNSHLQTSDPDIYAVGDAIEVKDFVSGAAVQIPLAGPANRQGRLAANHIFGGHAEYRGTQGTAILGIFDMTAAMTGSSERTLQMMKRPYRKVYTHPAHHAGYYPGAEGMTIKLMFDPEDGRILGAQAVGGAGVDKRIDILAMAIQGRMTVYDLEEAELAYAPQYGSAKDPINMIGFVGGEILRGGHPQTTVEELKFLDGDSDPARRPFVIDVRTPTEFHAGHLPGATNVPVDELRSRLNELPREQPLVVYCQVGQRGYLALRILLQNGFNARNLSGGYKTWLLYQS